MIKAIESPETPGLLLLGTDAPAAFGAVLDAQRAEMEAWRPLSASTDIDT